MLYYTRSKVLEQEPVAERARSRELSVGARQRLRSVNSSCELQIEAEGSVVDPAGCDRYFAGVCSTLRGACREARAKQSGITARAVPAFSDSESVGFFILSPRAFLRFKF